MTRLYPKSLDPEASLRLRQEPDVDEEDEEDDNEEEEDDDDDDGDKNDDGYSE